MDWQAKYTYYCYKTFVKSILHNMAPLKKSVIVFHTRTKMILTLLIMNTEQTGISDLQWRKLSTGMNWLKEQGSRLRLISTLSPASSRTAARFSSSNTCHWRDEQSSSMWSSAEGGKERVNIREETGLKEKKIKKLTEDEWRIRSHGKVRQEKPFNYVRG